MQKAGWSNSGTFGKFYKKEINKPNTFINKILKV
jgi:hypothetical protein